MISVIVYNNHSKLINNTIDSILMTSPPDLLSEILIVNDAEAPCDHEEDKKVKTVTIVGYKGKAVAWNVGADQCTGDILVFVKSATKFKADWLYPLMARLNERPNRMVSAKISILDSHLWATDTKTFDRFAVRYNLDLIERPSNNLPTSPILTNNCIAIKRDLFYKLGKFDEKLSIGAGEDIEFSLRAGLNDVSLEVVDDSEIACEHEIVTGKATSDNKIKIAEKYFGSKVDLFYKSANIIKTDVEDKLDELITPVVSFDNYVSRFLPELGKIYDLFESALNKSVCVVSDGPSIDLAGDLNSKYDIIIGADFIGNMIKCDYVYTDRNDCIESLLKSGYKENQIISPMIIWKDDVSSMFTMFKYPDVKILELSTYNTLPLSRLPPFLNVGCNSLTAVHIALFMNPNKIVIYGLDNKIVNGISHSIQLYKNGSILQDDEITKQRFNYQEFLLSKLGEISKSNNIPILRFNYV